ncbi:MAG: 4Fe-4S dicluster domain-containing protein [Alistipes sp.]|nr:4Fe-4S dicluster domain-containing protein [Alistipes sp.]
MKHRSNLLRTTRIVLATLFFTTVTLLFLGIGWQFNQWFAWVAKVQFLPALIALDFAVLAVLVVLTLIFGRLYCSVICPLGVMQDIFGWFGKKQKKNRYSYSSEKRWLRYSVLAIFILCLIIGFAPVTTLLAPYSAYGRIVNSIFRPLYDLLQNALAMVDTHFEWYLIPEAELWLRSVTTLVVALLTLLLLSVLAWRNGRTYCNTVCPVGTILSFFARFSLLRIEVDESKCNKCTLCERNCKAAAIDSKSGKVDLSRCVACGDCIDKCSHKAIHYKSISLSSKRKQEEQPTSQSKRAMMTGALLAVGTSAMAQAKIKVDGGLAEIEEKRVPHRDTPLTPPGSISARNMQKHCTACQLCVSACPNGVLRPSLDPMRFMQPEMSFERGFCRPECNRCSQICPTGAICAIKPEDKTAIRIGRAVWIKENCIPVTKGDKCGVCARNCEAKAILMVDYTTSDGRKVKVPTIDAERCIGCGECEYLCPARPLSAIYVEGYTTHHKD